MSPLCNGEIIQEVLALLIGALVLGVFGWLKFKRDEKIVNRFLKQLGVETGHAKRRKNRKKKAQ